jgi:hypothetical protein
MYNRCGTLVAKDQMLTVLSLLALTSTTSVPPLAVARWANAIP